MSGHCPGHNIEVAQNLARAEELIDAAKFAVAFVDVGLDAADDRNVDGLRVMEKIRSAGDETSIVVVTGRSGQDVLSITRDAIKKYGAFDTVGKSTIKPADIKRLLEDGLEAYRKAVISGRMAAREVLRGGAEPMSWDARVMRISQFRGDAGKFYDLLTELVGDYQPIVARKPGQGMDVDEAAGLAHGAYWSRSVGAAIVVCFGAIAAFDKAAASAGKDGRLLGTYSVGEPLRTLINHGVKGAVFPLHGGRREDFADSQAPETG